LKKVTQNADFYEKMSFFSKMLYPVFYGAKRGPTKFVKLVMEDNIKIIFRFIKKNGGRHATFGEKSEKHAKPAFLI